VPACPTSARAVSETLAKRYVVAQRRHQELVATARALCHASQVQRVRRQVARERRGGGGPLPMAWFAVEGVIDDQVVRGHWGGGRLTCDRLLRSRAALLVDLGAEFVAENPPRRYLASLDAPATAVMLTLIRACDRVSVIQLDLPAR
jgi:hypothetical protein